MNSCPLKSVWLKTDWFQVEFHRNIHLEITTSSPGELTCRYDEFAILKIPYLGPGFLLSGLGSYSNLIRSAALGPETGWVSLKLKDKERTRAEPDAGPGCPVDGFP